MATTTKGTINEMVNRGTTNQIIISGSSTLTSVFIGPHTLHPIFRAIVDLIIGSIASLVASDWWRNFRIRCCGEKWGNDFVSVCLFCGSEQTIVSFKQIGANPHIE